jgi:hypothetical protein
MIPFEPATYGGHGRKIGWFGVIDGGLSIMRIVGALIFIAVFAAVMVPLIRMLWLDRPNRGDNYQGGGEISGGDYSGGHGGGEGDGH